MFADTMLILFISIATALLGEGYDSLKSLFYKKKRLEADIIPFKMNNFKLNCFFVLLSLTRQSGHGPAPVFFCTILYSLSDGAGCFKMLAF